MSYKYTTYRADGSKEYVYENTYDENNNQLKSLRTDYDAAGNVTGTRIGEYKDGREIEVTFYNADGSFSMHAKYEEFDENGWVTKIVYYNEEGDATGYDILEHDDQGRTTIQKSYSKDGTYQGWWEYTYNDTDNGHESTSIWHDASTSSEAIED